MLLSLVTHWYPTMQVMVMDFLASCWMSYLQARRPVIAAMAAIHNLGLQRYI
jgi:hypothetical protein